MKDKTIQDLKVSLQIMEKKTGFSDSVSHFTSPSHRRKLNRRVTQPSEMDMSPIRELADDLHKMCKRTEMVNSLKTATGMIKSRFCCK